MSELEQVELYAGPTVRELPEAVGILPTPLAAVAREGELISKDRHLQDGETLNLLKIMSGG